MLQVPFSALTMITGKQKGHLACIKPAPVILVPASPLLTDLIQHTHTHTHPFNGPFSGTTRVGRYQKGKTNLDFTEARGSGISWATCKSTPCSRQITTPAPHHSVFYRPDALPATQPTESKHWKQDGHDPMHDKFRNKETWSKNSQ